jgi:hypothetical protein
MRYYAGLSCSDTRKHQRTAHPVGSLDDAQAIGVAVGDEDKEGERNCTHQVKDKFKSTVITELDG